ncbi:hypothetical protein ABE438_16100 [Bosea sp. TWI1241]|uniref:hypothetical protein n=1 Tax=Bosea sp. TWI1241 TaxID=3148904 RepID=UPI00320B4F0F
MLRLHYDSQAPLPAADVGAILMEVSKGFERYSRMNLRQRGLHLAVQRVELGSLIADLIALGTSTTMAAMQHREALYGFIGFVSNALSIAQGLASGRNKAADDRMIETLQKPIAQGESQQLNIFVVGNGNVVTFDKESVKLVREAKEAVHAEAASIAYETDSMVRTISNNIKAPKLLSLDGKFGTAISVKRNWYVRLEGEGGVLNPLHCDPNVSVEDDRAYLFDGIWEGRSYRIRAARPVP